MGLATELGYRHRSPNMLQRANQRITSTGPGSWFVAKLLRHLDDGGYEKYMQRISGRRVRILVLESA